MENIKEENFDEIINSDKLTIIDFSATWCMPCRMLKPIMERVAEAHKDVAFYNLDIDECEAIAKRYRVFSVPTVMAFRSGKKLNSIVGLNPYEVVDVFVANSKLIKAED